MGGIRYGSRRFRVTPSPSAPSLPPLFPPRSAEASLEPSRTETLLRAVVEASRHLAAAPDLSSGMVAALAALGELTGLDRVYVVRYDHAEQAGVFVAERCAPGIASVTATVGAGPYAYSEYEEVWRPLMADRTYSTPIGEKTGANAALNLAAGTRSDLFVPVFVGQEFWGAIGFDDCTTERVYSAAEIQVLRGAGAALSAALGRFAAESARIAAERARADDAHALSCLLESVVAASRALLDEPDFQAGLQRWLATLAQAVDADRAGLGGFTEADDPGHVAVSRVDWAKPDLANLANVRIPASRDFVAWTERLRRGESIWACRDELLDPDSVRYWEATHCFTNLLVPVVVDRATVAWLSFDWRTRREWRPMYGSLLRTAADGVAAALKRNDAVQAALAEREARTALLERSNAELRRRDALLTAAARSLKSLFGARDLGPAVNEALRRMGEAGGMHRVKVILQRPDPAGAYHELTYEWWAPEFASQASLGLTRFPDDTLDVYLEPLRAGRSVWQFIDEVPEFFRDAFLRVGMQSMGIVPIFAGARYIGLVAFDDCRSRRVWSQSEMDALTIAARGLGAAIQHEILIDEKIEAVARERAAAAKQRADALSSVNALLTRRSRLLGAVTEVSQLLLSGADPVTLLQPIADILGPASGADRAGFMLATPPDGGSARGYLKLVAEWVAPGVPRQLDVPSALVMNLDLVPIAEWLTNGVLIVAPAELDASLRAGRTASRIHSELGIPIIVEGELWGSSGFDDCSGGRVWDDGEIGALKIANALIANAVSRRRADEARLTAESSRRTAVQTERNRLARDIHDTLAQSFTGILLQLEAADLLREQGDPRAAERYRKIRTQAQLGLAETRRTALALAPEALNDGLLPALTQLCQRSHVEERMRCSFSYEGLARRLPSAHEERLLRVAKEALSNAVRHGRATEIALHLAFAPAEVTLHVVDNGVGFAVGDGSGLGLPGMRAALAEAGGNLIVASAPAAGTTITAVVPTGDAPSAKHPMAPRPQNT
jgi:signal transduction histidine kinase